MKKKSIVRLAKERLWSMAAWGQSKHDDKSRNNGKPAMDKIYSHSTMDNYVDAAVLFVEWARTEHGCKTLEDARQFTGEYLNQRVHDGKSAYTVRRDAAALGKLYQTATTELGADLPARERKNVTQHRQDKSRGHFSEKKNADLVALCKATGLRRHEVAALQPGDVTRNADGSVSVRVRQCKGGKARTVTALDDSPYRLAQKAVREGRGTVIAHIPKYAPVHEYRADFAMELYRRLARPLEDLPQRERYVCRKDRAGTQYDRAAMKAVSVQLGHNRVDVVTHYLE